MKITALFPLQVFFFFGNEGVGVIVIWPKLDETMCNSEPVDAMTCQ